MSLKYLVLQYLSFPVTHSQCVYAIIYVMLTERSLVWDRNVWDDVWKGKTQEDHSSHDQLVKWAEVYLKGFRYKRTLEVGSGSGADSAEMAKRGAIAFAVDFSKNATRLTRLISHKSGVGVQAIRGDALSLPFSSSVFDLVFSEGLLEHVSLEDRQKVLEEQLRVLKPNGIIIVDIPLNYEIRRSCDETLLPLEKRGRLRLLRQYNWTWHYFVQESLFTGASSLRAIESGIGYVYRGRKPSF